MIVHWKYVLPRQLVYNFSCLSLKIVNSALHWRWIFVFIAGWHVAETWWRYLNISWLYPIVKWSTVLSVKHHTINVFYSFSGQAKQSIQNTPWVMFRWRNHSCRDTKAKAISSTWKASFTIWRKTNKIIVRTIGRVRHIFSVQLYTGRLWLFILFLKPQYQYVSKFLEEADLRHSGDSFWLFYGS